MRVLVLVVLAGLLSAGCVGKDEQAPGKLESAVDKLTGPTDAELRATPGSIQGVVRTSAVEPISGATVTLLRENVSVRSDASGFFRFDKLANGAYLVSASADGFVTRTTQATATNGTVYEIEMVLTPAPSKVPYDETRELAGLIACGAKADGPTGRQEPACSTADPNHRDRFEIDIAPSSGGLIVELTWDPEANPGAQRMRLHAETVGYGASDVDLGDAVGSGYVRIEVSPDVLTKFYSEGGRFRAIVSLEPQDAAPVGAAFQMPFTVYSTVFYHSPAPTGFAIAS